MKLLGIKWSSQRLQKDPKVNSLFTKEEEEEIKSNLANFK